MGIGILRYSHESNEEAFDHLDEVSVFGIMMIKVVPIIIFEEIEKMLVYLQTIETEEDRHKFEIIYRAYRNELFALANDILNNEHDAEDVVHHGFLKLAENITKVGDPLSRRTKGYIVTIIENRAIDVYRAKKAHPTVPFGDGAANGRVDAPEYSDLPSCILKLPVRQRSILILKYHHGYELKEIAKVLGITYANALKIDYRAKERLKELCEEAEIEW